MSPVSVTLGGGDGRLSVDPASSSSPEKLAVATLGRVWVPPVSVMLPANVVQALVTCESVPSSVTSTSV